jgi:hypothetical protein
MGAVEQFDAAAISLTAQETARPLQMAVDPFAAAASGSPVGHGFQNALYEVMHYIGERTPVVVVSGRAGTGKSLLMEMTARACLARGMSVRREARGDLVDPARADRCDVLLVDEADVLPSGTLHALLAAGRQTRPASLVFICLPTSVPRFDGIGKSPALVELGPMSANDARTYLQERAATIGRPDLFTPEAINLVIGQSRGLPRLLRQNASLAFFAAASEGRANILAQHVIQGLQARSVAPPPAESSGAAQQGNTQDTVDPIKGGPEKPIPEATPPAALPASDVADQLILREAEKMAEAERRKAEQDANELARAKRLESNRIFYHSWRFGK